ncbi:MAG: DUF4129 domain-containing protein [Planctomycetes bacterium]|nr:DUF4129 domain-containing protein [Planctomycetota bacterium]
MAAQAVCLGTIAVLLASTWASGWPPSPSPDLKPYRESLDEILGRREFGGTTRELGMDSDAGWRQGWFSSFLKWLKRGLAKFFAELKAWLMRVLRRQGQARSAGPWFPVVSRTTAWTMGMIGGCLLAFVLFRYFMGRQVSSPVLSSSVSVHEPMVDALAKPMEEWNELAERFVSEGHWRLALRARYLAILSLLHGRHFIHYTREKTNGEYVWAMASTRAGEAFAVLTLIFDRSWYGKKAVEQRDYDVASRWAQSVDETTRGAS